MIGFHYFGFSSDLHLSSITSGKYAAQRPTCERGLTTTRRGSVSARAVACSPSRRAFLLRTVFLSFPRGRSSAYPLVEREDKQELCLFPFLPSETNRNYACHYHFDIGSVGALSLSKSGNGVLQDALFTYAY